MTLTYSLGKVAVARQTMRRVLDLAPDSPQCADANSFLAMTALDENPTDLPAHEREVQKLLDADPNYVPAMMVRAAIQVQQGESKAAVSTKLSTGKGERSDFVWSLFFSCELLSLLVTKNIRQVTFKPVHHLLKPPQGDTLLTLFPPEDGAWRQTDLLGELGKRHLSTLFTQEFCQFLVEY